MKLSKDTPAFLRYFSARLKPFTTPLFWGSLGGLLIAGFAIYQYWQHPEWLQTSSESVEDSTTITSDKLPSNVSSEDLAAAADLDNIDLLLQEINQNNSLSAIAESSQDNQSSELKREESAFSRLQKQQKARFSNPNQSSAKDSNSYSLGIDEGNKKIMELLKPPSFSSYQPNQTNSNSTLKGISQNPTDIIPNPVGNIYLSNKSKQPSTNSPTPSQIPSLPTSELANPGVVSNPNLSGGVVSTTNGQNLQNPQVNSNIPQSNPVNPANPVNPSVSSNFSNTNQFVPASSAIQSQQTLPNSINSGLNTSSTNTGFNSLNPYPTNSSDINSNTVNGVNPNSTNQITPNPTNTPTNSLTQPYQNTVIPGLTSNPNEIRRDDLTNIQNSNNGSSPNSLQNNYRSYKLNTSNYNSSTPSAYQLQPQNYSTGLNNTTNLNNQNPNRNRNNYNQTSNNPPAINVGTPSLQPSGTLSTSEVNR
jgi:hypothetical protein